jgi:predicted phosphodiesterase
LTRILVISDIHSNITALEAVLEDAGSIDETWCLGDVVGYGPDPNECVACLRELPTLNCLMGNHDLAATGNMNLDIFNSDARTSLLWQKKVLSIESMEFLKSHPQELQVCRDVSMVHGSPRDPVWEYILNASVALENLESFSTQWCCIGHTHFQSIFQYYPDDNKFEIELPKTGEIFHLNGRSILNPGSVGQPRDRDIRAAYAIYDPEANTWQPKRINYNFKEVQDRILEAGLPARHAKRLGSGW